MKLLLALSLYTAAAPDGGVRLDSNIYASCPAAPPIVEMDGGWYMPNERAARLSCIVTACEVDRSRRAEESKNSLPPPPWMAWVAGLVIAATAGFSVGRGTR